MMLPAAGIVLPDGRTIDSETFYQERDQRTGIERPLVMEPYPVALVLPASVAATREGHLALFWCASMLRRMGRAFAASIVIAPLDALRAPYQGTLGRGVGDGSLRAVLENELSGADPFASISYRDPEGPGAFDDINLAIWLGSAPPRGAPTPTDGHISVMACGWIAHVTCSPEGPHEATEAARGLVGAVPTVVLATALGVGAVYRIAHRESLPVAAQAASRVWVALDSGRVTTDDAQGEIWERDGRSDPGAPSWSPGTEGVPAPRMEALALVSAGALCGNAARILADSHLPMGRAVVIDPDTADLSNLNRLIGIGVGQVGFPKALLTASILQATGATTAVVLHSYERWSATGEAAAFRAPGHGMLVGVDQVGTRLEAQADWPHLLVNGGTSGTGWNVSAHRPTTACVGCWYSSARQSYALSRRPQACGGVGAGLGPKELPPLASYPFASVAAAAVMVAVLQQAVAQGAHASEGEGAEVRRMNTLNPGAGVVEVRARTPGCLLLCGAEYVRAVLDPGAPVGEPPAPPPQPQTEAP